jgi:hypothetical protein
MRMLGAWSARAIFLIEVAYVAVFVAGFASIRNTSDPRSLSLPVRAGGDCDRQPSPSRANDRDRDD